MQQQDPAFLFICSAGCGQVLCWSCRTANSVCVRGGACQAKLGPPFHGARCCYPADQERVAKWRALALVVDTSFVLASHGTMADGSMLGAHRRNGATYSIAQWLIWWAAEKGRESSATDFPRESHGPAGL